MDRYQEIYLLILIFQYDHLYYLYGLQKLFFLDLNLFFLPDVLSFFLLFHYLILLKAKGFKNAANITLGLPFIRTSVDHGTALDLAGSGNISLGSFNTALSYFKKLTDNASST